MKIIGYYSLGLCGYEILEIIYGIDDKIKWRYCTDKPEKKIHTTKIYYTNSGRAFFKVYGTYRIYLDECLRV